MALPADNGPQATDDRRWAVDLFRKAVLKQRKLSELEAQLGSTEGRRCLDLGSERRR